MVSHGCGVSRSGRFYLLIRVEDIIVGNTQHFHKGFTIRHGQKEGCFVKGSSKNKNNKIKKYPLMCVGGRTLEWYT